MWAAGSVARMGRPQTYDASTDVCEDVSRDAYVGGHRPMPHLFDLVLLRALGADTCDEAANIEADVDIARLAAVVAEQAERQSDVRLLVDGAQRYLTAARELADRLGCDVYLPPAEAQIRYVRESSSVTGESWDAVAVHTSTGEPTPWLLVRPAERSRAVPARFVSTAGRLRPNNGLMTVPLSQGLAFATAASFPETAALAGHITASPPGVTTLAVTADIGRFEISRFDEVSALLGGVEFATLVAASLDTIEPDVQLALTWPADAAACEALDVELMRFADALNRTVWVPRPAGSAGVLPDRGEFRALDRRGRPSTWHAYASRLAIDWEPNLGTDAEGRLTPVDELSTARPGPVEEPIDPIEQAVRLAERTAARPVFMPASPTILLATLRPRPAHLIVAHCVSWLSPSVVVNQDPLELYVWLRPAAGNAERGSVSSPDIFLLADSDPARLADRTRAGHLLRLTAPARTAVDLSKHADQAPTRVRDRILDAGSTHLLALIWIDRYEVTAWFDVDSVGGVTVRRDFVPGTLDVQFEGAEHGIPGLPNDVVHWPGQDQRSDTPSYLLVSEGTAIAHSGFAALSRARPPLRDRQRILEIRVRRRRAIDVPATLDRLGGLPMIKKLRDFAGLDVLLSEQDFGRAVVSKVWRCGPGGEPVVDKLGGETLSDVLAGST
jgi:hypothetical protein